MGSVFGSPSPHAAALTAGAAATTAAVMPRLILQLLCKEDSARHPPSAIGLRRT
jgi:hypothetical protein